MGSPCSCRLPASLCSLPVVQRCAFFLCIQVLCSPRQGSAEGTASLDPCRPRPPLVYRLRLEPHFVVGALCIVMDARDNPRRSRSRSRSIRRIGSCDSCPACAVNRGILLRILHTVQELHRSTSLGPTSVGSGRPALDLAEVFTGAIDQASILMAQPRTAALAVRHLESRCDSIVRSLDALEASVHRRRD